MKPLSRRKILGAAGLVTLGSLAARLPAAAQDNSKTFGMSILDVKNFGVVGDGAVLDSAAINRAIDECHGRGGGIVYVSPGNYLCGTVVLKSNVTLHLEAGATLLGSKKLSDYTAQPFKPSAPDEAVFASDIRDTGPRHLIFARDAENIGLSGGGKIDGQGAAYWIPSKRVPPPPEDAWKDVIAFDWKAGARPSPMLEFYNCKNLHIEDVWIQNAPGWTLRPICCDGVFIHGITIKNPVYAPNADGIDATCCRNVFISDCLIETGDDAICLKSENPYGDEPGISKNITVTNCVLSGCCNAFKFGTATFGAYENIVFSNSVIFNDDVPLNSRFISGIALEMVDGGSVDGVVISNIRMQRVRTPIFIRRGGRHLRADGSPGTLRNVTIENIQATESILTSSITGLAGFNVEDVRLSGIHIESQEAGKVEWMNREIPDVAKMYPEARMFGRLPGYGLYCRHVKGLRLQDVEFTAAAGEERPAIVCDQVEDVEIAGLKSSSITGGQPMIKLVQTKKVFIHGCTAPDETKTFLTVQGDRTKQVVLAGNNLLSAAQDVDTGKDVPEKAVTAQNNVTVRI